MALFGRSKDEDEDYEDEEIDEEEEERGERRLKRKFKDLHSENKRKRKELPKPWGKQERFTILIILAATIIIAAFLAISSRLSAGGNFKPSLPKINLDSLNIFKEETIIIQKQ